MKKGISPLIATVIIIGMVIVIAVLIMMFGSEFVKKSTQRVDVETEERTICMQDVNFEIRSACYLNPDRLKVLIFNTGKKDIREFYARLYENVDTVSESQKKQTIKAGQIGALEFSVESEDIKQIEMFPMVRYNLQSLTCANNVISYGDYFGTNFGACTS